ncbi:hypothetical protein C1646_748237 [Rhizophagus diaphanus]|nr:hypothetical protein C1646_748237 [Rhizophagus diaphanus] [Rhizophagus sp. MUCL 43196]
MYSRDSRSLGHLSEDGRSQFQEANKLETLQRQIGNSDEQHRFRELLFRLSDGEPTQYMRSNLLSGAMRKSVSKYAENFEGTVVHRFPLSDYVPDMSKLKFPSPGRRPSRKEKIEDAPKKREKRKKFLKNYEEYVESDKTASHAATLLHQIITPNSASRTSGTLLFGLQLCCVSKNHERKYHLRPVGEVSNSTLCKRARNLATSVYNNFQNQNFGENKENKRQKIEAIIQFTDQGLISRNAYRNLSAIEQNLPREYLIFAETVRINKAMENLIPIKMIDVHHYISSDIYNKPEIFDDEVINQMASAIGKGGYRSIKDILKYIVPGLINNGILNPIQPIINLRISGDGRNVGKKIKHVMITCAVLDDKENLHFPDKHFTTVLYPGNENYDPLKNAMDLFLKELHELKDYDDRGDLETRWEISKTMEQLNNNYKVYKGHQKMPLFNMIPLDHWLIDELHIMLRITDRLWKLVLDELREIHLFDDLSRNVIVKEMCRIKVKFQFWKDKETGIWSHSSLMGEDKMKVLRKFNLELLFPPSRTTKIRKLWSILILGHGPDAYPGPANLIG